MIRPFLACLFTLVLGLASAQAAPVTLAWEDLMPEGEEEKLDQLYDEFYRALEKRFSSLDAIAEGSDYDRMVQIGTFNTVEALDGKAVRLPGFIVPFDFSFAGRFREFLLVPYFGACIHMPPPPPNQIVYVDAGEGVEIRDIWQPVWLTGTLRTVRHENEVGNAAYTLTLDAIEPYRAN